ncbi:alpha/beta fold hydrolase [Streptomyces sp. NPDC059009]|uniref:alpha/beta fold hydrolase n=1 Tax=Streptomyces sp. NPDC059009 TaxID=3346694 RepID=UPI0036B2D6B3
MTFVRIGGVPHHAQVTGDGAGPVCVLSAGLGLPCSHWDSVVPLLTGAGWTTVTFDRPGVGRSAPARTAPALGAEADRIAHVLDALGLGARRVTAVGHSLAGFHVEAFARRHPGRTAGLVLVDSSVPFHRGGRQVRPLPARAARLGVARAAGQVVRGAGGGLMEYATYGEVAQQLTALRDQLPLPAGVPVSVLAAYAGGSRGWLEQQRGLAERLGASYEVAYGSGHLVARDAPGQVAEVIERTR